MILSGDNAKRVRAPRRILFGEEWFVSATHPVQDFYGVVINDDRPQPFPTRAAAERFANAEADRRHALGQVTKVQVIDKNYNVLLDLTSNII